MFSNQINLLAQPAKSSEIKVSTSGLVPSPNIQFGFLGLKYSKGQSSPKAFFPASKFWWMLSFFLRGRINRCQVVCASFFNGPPAADQPLWPPIGLQFRQVFTPTNTRSHAVYYRMVTLPQVLHNSPHVLISLFEVRRKELYKAKCEYWGHGDIFMPWHQPTDPVVPLDTSARFLALMVKTNSCAFCYPTRFMYANICNGCLLGPKALDFYL